MPSDTMPPPTPITDAPKKKKKQSSPPGMPGDLAWLAELGELGRVYMQREQERALQVQGLVCHYGAADLAKLLRARAAELGDTPFAKALDAMAAHLPVGSTYVLCLHELVALYAAPPPMHGELPTIPMPVTRPFADIVEDQKNGRL